MGIMEKKTVMMMVLMVVTILTWQKECYGWGTETAEDLVRSEAEHTKITAETAHDTKDKTSSWAGWVSEKISTGLGSKKDEAEEAADNAGYAKDFASDKAGSSYDSAQNAKHYAYDKAGDAKDMAYDKAGQAKYMAYDKAGRAKDAAYDKGKGVIKARPGCLPTSAPDLDPSVDDIYLWNLPSSGQPGQFSTAKTWLQLHPSGPQMDWHNSVWFKHRIPKHAFIFWIQMRGRMTTRDRLLAWGMQVPPGCLLCNADVESSGHLFLTCPFSQEIWRSLTSHPSLNPPALFSQIVQWVTRASSLPKLNTICCLLLQASVYEVWRERNARVHGAPHRGPRLIVKDIQLTIRSKLAFLDRQTLSCSPLIVLSHQSRLTYLSTWFGFVQFANAPPLQ